jgi:hypothetical protein
MIDAVREQVATLAAQRVAAYLRVLQRMELTPETFIVPVASYDTSADYAFFQARTADPITQLMDPVTFQEYNRLVRWGLESRGWQTQAVPIRREEFEPKVEEWDATR